MIAYKLLRQRKDQSLGPLFINRKQRIPVGVWLDAEPHWTKGFAFRPGWHVMLKPYAPHLSKRDRIWCTVLVDDYELYDRPARQGGLWALAKKLMVLHPTARLLTNWISP